jgi:hypothetical protein
MAAAVGVHDADRVAARVAGELERAVGDLASVGREGGLTVRDLAGQRPGRVRPVRSDRVDVRSGRVSGRARALERDSPVRHGPRAAPPEGARTNAATSAAATSRKPARRRVLIAAPSVRAPVAYAARQRGVRAIARCERSGAPRRRRTAPRLSRPRGLPRMCIGAFSSLPRLGPPRSGLIVKLRQLSLRTTIEPCSSGARPRSRSSPS